MGLKYNRTHCPFCDSTYKDVVKSVDDYGFHAPLQCDYCKRRMPVEGYKPVPKIKISEKERQLSDLATKLYNVLGPSVPTCIGNRCQGCLEEWAQALQYLRELAPEEVAKVDDKIKRRGEVNANRQQIHLVKSPEET